MNAPKANSPAWQAQLFAVRDESIDIAVVLLALLSLPALAVDLARARAVGWQWAMTVHVGLTALLWGVFIVRYKIPATIKGSAALVSLFTIGLCGLLTYGLASWGAAYFMAVVLLTTLLFGQLWGLFALASGVIASCALAIAVATHRLTFSIDLNAYNMRAVDWLQLPVLLTFVAATLLAVGGRLYSALSDELSDSALRAEALRKSEQDYRLLAENSTDVILRLSPALELLYASPACRQVLGFSPDQLVGRAAMELVHPDDRDAAARSVAHGLVQPRVEIAAFRIVRADGTTVWCEATGLATRNARTGEVSEFQLTVRDISTRKQAEDALREVAEERLEQARVAEALAEASAALGTAIRAGASARHDSAATGPGVALHHDPGPCVSGLLGSSRGRVRRVPDAVGFQGGPTFAGGASVPAQRGAGQLDAGDTGRVRLGTGAMVDG